MSDEGEALWEGNFIDANGRHGSVSALLSTKRNLAGLTMLVVELAISPTQVIWEASLDGQDPRAGVRLETSYNLPAGGTHRWELDLSPADPGVFAVAALSGGYKVTTEGIDARIPLSSGVMVLWLFLQES